MNNRSIPNAEVRLLNEKDVAGLKVYLTDWVFNPMYPNIIKHFFENSGTLIGFEGENNEIVVAEFHENNLEIIIKENISKFTTDFILPNFDKLLKRSLNFSFIEGDDNILKAHATKEHFYLINKSDKTLFCLSSLHSSNEVLWTQKVRSIDCAIDLCNIHYNGTLYDIDLEKLFSRDTTNLSYARKELKKSMDDAYCSVFI